MNLTRIAQRDAAEVQHVADALTLLPFLPTGEISIADVGSGGGVPGIPLAIARPDATRAAHRIHEKESDLPARGDRQARSEKRHRQRRPRRGNRAGPIGGRVSTSSPLARWARWCGWRNGACL